MLKEEDGQREGIEHKLRGSRTVKLEGKHQSPIDVIISTSVALGNSRCKQGIPLFREEILPCTQVLCNTEILILLY